ncbi:hypothetical protein [Micromonospora sp. NPDC048830]|uniref:hypothetical protein n=1 Tax=Micromonospora sp. NPDC048830 TaxID=3364257 RepID=UPI00371EB07A
MAGWIWVRGHNLECRWPSVACARDWCAAGVVLAEVALLVPYPCWQVEWATSRQARTTMARFLGVRV